MPSTPPLLPRAASRFAAWCGVIVLAAAVGAVVIWLSLTLKAVVTPVLLAILGTALLGPVYGWLVRLKVNRSIAAFLTCLCVVVVVGGAGYIVVNALVDTGDQIVASVRDAAKTLSEHFGFAGTSLDDLASNAKSLLSRYGATAASEVVNGISLVAELIATAVLALLLIFFFLRDAERIARAFRSLAPASTGEAVEAMARHAFRAVAGFMHGTTLIALIDAVCITAGLLILRVPGAFGLGALVFVGAYIPFVGALLSGSIAVLVALADRGVVIGLWVLAVLIAVEAVEGHLLQPLIQSRTVQMHPAVILLAITAGAGTAGILGTLLAVPLTAAALGVLSEVRARMPPSDPGDPPAPPSPQSPDGLDGGAPGS
ncbi:AI-2E family transporter [Streptomyces liangshanensis]|uniref:AI-2E family transporter n=1 Tax=Streptomyces liangshanensis TaxID=2717324 RepID=A0A6G9H8Q9_9ACTN|nr:AI-2E family transporter [Streptomyces liangshanensis]QIQ06948.1 AI-2E family transporter [Streptomyces liangshanensis]